MTINALHSRSELAMVFWWPINIIVIRCWRSIASVIHNFGYIIWRLRSMSKIMKVINGKLEGYTPEEAERKRNTNRAGMLSPHSQAKIRKALNIAQHKTDKVNFNGGPSELYNPVTKLNDNIVNGENGPLILKVKRGKRVLDEHYCAQCNKFQSSLWRYQNSNYGIVYLCQVCKTTAFERTYGHADAMPLKVDHAHAHKGKW